jgi:DNA-binding CsgD family transcriptional regulator
LYFAAFIFGRFSQIGRQSKSAPGCGYAITASESKWRMKQPSKASARRRSIVDPTLEKPLLRLHAAIDIDSFWKAVRKAIQAALPTCFIGLTLQHAPILPRIVRWTKKMPRGVFPIDPFEAYFITHPCRKLVLVSDFFPDERSLKKSLFYRNYMAPVNGRHAIGLFFWNAGRLLGVLAVMRNAKQGPLSRLEMKRLRQLYTQFQTALGRLRSLEREHTVRVALEQFMRRVPLPTILLRWNLRLVYRNQAASDFCSVWQHGTEEARLIKSAAPLPPEILDRCGVLRQRWEGLNSLNFPRSGFKEELVHHPKRRHLRATISLKQISSAGVARPHFLIEFENLRGSDGPERKIADARLSHLARLTRREQQLARLVCDGRSNQEIADESGLSLETVKKHLHSVYGKLEVNSRSRLMALMR